MRRWLWVSAFLVGTAAPAQATGEKELLRWLDGDAPLAMRLEPQELEAVTVWTRKSGGEIARWAGLAQFGAGSILGFHLADASGWKQAGLAPEVGFLTIGAIDREEAQRANQRRAPLWRSRLVVRAADPERAEQRLSSAFALKGTLRLSSGSAAELTDLLGVPADDTDAVFDRLVKAGVFFVGRVPAARATVLGHRHGDVVVLDFVMPFAARDVKFPIHGAALEARLSPPSAAADPGPLSDAGLRAHIAPDALITAIEALEWESRLPPGKRTHWRCRRMRDLSQEGLFRGMTLAIRTGDERAGVSLRWDLADDSPLPAALRTAPASIASPGQSGTIATAALWLKTVRGLRGLPRPLLLSRPWESPHRTARGCGRGADLILYSLAWPQLAGLFLDEIAAIDPEAETMLNGLGGIAFAARSLGEDPRSWTAVTEAALSKPAAKVVSRWFDVIFGSRRGRTWGRGRLRAYATGGAHPVIGFASGERSLAWSADEVARPRAKNRPLFEFHAHGTRSAEHLPIPPAFRGLVKLMKRVDGVATVSDDAIDLEVDITWAENMAPER